MGYPSCLFLFSLVTSSPTVELPPDAAAAPDAGKVDRRQDGSGIGGYAELHYNRASAGGESEAELDLHRLVIFLSHQLGGGFRFYSEVEVEHAFSAAGAPGEVAVEQAFIDWLLAGELLALRAGVVLVPMGIINQWHEPPVFNGVERPLVERNIIPSTWREGGIGLWGKPLESLRYQLYLVGGLDPSDFDAERGIRGGRQHVAEASADALALTGRLELEPTLGSIIGASAYYGEAGPNAADLDGGALALDVPVLGLSADARTRLGGFEARAVLATFSIGNSAGLREAIDTDAGARLLGYYVEAGYDLLDLFERDEQLVLFGRYELVDTLQAIEGRARTTSDANAEITDVVLGLTFRPVPQVVVKGDVILRSFGGDAADRTLVSLGAGVMF